MSENNSTKFWMAIVISILISASSICYGVIQGVAAKRVSNLRARVERNSEVIQDMKPEMAVIKNELKNINKNVDEIKKILDKER